MYPILLHTNSEYQDILNLFIESADKYLLSNNHTLIYLSDIEVSGKDCILYRVKDSYPKRLLNALKSIDSNIVGLLHEDFILYDFPKYETLNNLITILQGSEFDFIRMIRSNDNIDKNIIGKLYKTPNFAIQATFFKKRYLEKYLTTFIEKNIWALESSSPEFDTQGLFFYDGEPLRGAVHHDSNLFPYMATAIVKGKWNTEYKKELLQLRPEEFFSTRGWTK